MLSFDVRFDRMITCVILDFALALTVLFDFFAGNIFIVNALFPETISK